MEIPHPGFCLVHVSKGTKMNEVMLHKLLSGQASATEKARFENWISEDSAHVACFEKMKLIWMLAGDVHPQVDADTDTEWLKFQQRIAAIPFAGHSHDDTPKIFAPPVKAVVSKSNFERRAEVQVSAL